MAEIYNDVPAYQQMIHSETVSFLGNPEAPLRILILGNSITRHGPKEDIGWPHDWGMAASCQEKDFVHRLYTMLTQSGSDVYMRICQVAAWEREFRDPRALEAFTGERDFLPNVIVFRLCENVAEADVPDFGEAAEKLIQYIRPQNCALVVTSSFWPHAAKDPLLRQLSRKLGGTFVDIGYTDDDMLALGKFEHRGVSIHPGDKGMEMIASKLFPAISEGKGEKSHVF